MDSDFVRGLRLFRRVLVVGLAVLSVVALVSRDTTSGFYLLGFALLFK